MKLYPHFLTQVCSSMGQAIYPFQRLAMGSEKRYPSYQSCRLALLIKWYTSISVKVTIDIFGDLSVITHILRSNCKSISRGKYWALTLSNSNAIQDSGSAPCPETYTISFRNDLHHLAEPSLKAALRDFLTPNYVGLSHRYHGIAE